MTDAELLKSYKIISKFLIEFELDTNDLGETVSMWHETATRYLQKDRPLTEFLEIMRSTNLCEDSKLCMDEIERLMGEDEEITQFVMNIEPHTPQNPDRACLECVLRNGPCCLDRSYCRLGETGKTWKKKLPEESEE